MGQAVLHKTDKGPEGILLALDAHHNKHEGRNAGHAAA